MEAAEREDGVSRTEDSKAAMEVLISQYGYTVDQFAPDEDTGVWMYWWRCSHEYDEWDEKPAQDQLETEKQNHAIDFDLLAALAETRTTDAD